MGTPEHPALVHKAAEKIAGFKHPQWGWVLGALALVFGTLAPSFIRFACLTFAGISALYAFHHTARVARRWRLTGWAVPVVLILCTGLFFGARRFDPDRGNESIPNAAGSAALPNATGEARVRITDLKVVTDQLDRTPHLNVHFKNLGNEPTPIHHIYRTGLAPGPQTDSIRLELEESLASDLKGGREFSVNREKEWLIPPGAERMTTAFRRARLSKSEFAKLSTGALTLYFVGAIRYSVNGQIYQSTYCAFLRGGMDPVYFCNQHNEEHLRVKPVTVAHPAKPDTQKPSQSAANSPGSMQAGRDIVINNPPRPTEPAPVTSSFQWQKEQWKNDEAGRPVVRITIVADGPIPKNTAFVAITDRPCKGVMVHMEGPYRVPPLITAPNDPNVCGFILTRAMEAREMLLFDVRSEDSSPIQIRRIDRKHPNEVPLSLWQ